MKNDSELLKVVLIGNPNTGKSTIFNGLTGAHQKTGNWPGVTVDKRIGTIHSGNKKFIIIDLPGIYSLDTNSQEEIVVTNYLRSNDFDVVINILDASNIERNLFLTIQLLEKNIPLLVNLNMIDEAEKNGLQIDKQKLESFLGVPVSNTIGKDRKSVQKLLEDFLQSSLKRREPSGIVTAYTKMISEIRQSDLSKKEINEKIISERYTLINKIVSDSVTTHATRKDLTDKLDSYFANGITSLLIMFVTFYLMFQIAFNWIGQPLADVLSEFFEENVVEFANDVMNRFEVEEWMRSLISDGIIVGVGAVLSFFPLIFVLFLCLSFLDGTGYMSRVAFIMDPIMHRVGLSGKGIMPLIMGFGCAVPAIMGARALDTNKDRMISILITPFLTCNAKVPIISLLATIFFPKNASNIIFIMYCLGIITAIIMARILNATIFKGEQSVFLLELPPYRLPDLKTVLFEAWDRAKGYLIKAGTIIFAMSVLIWFLSHFNSNGMTNKINNSYLVNIGHVSSSIFKFHNFDTWEIGAATVTGLLAKEAVVSTLKILYNENILTSSEDTIDYSENILKSSINRAFTPLSAVAFMVFVQLYSPCVTALGTIKKETNSWRWMLFAFFYTCVVAWSVSLLFYQFGKFLGFE